jgi:hypothetical protein
MEWISIMEILGEPKMLKVVYGADGRGFHLIFIFTLYTCSYACFEFHKRSISHPLFFHFIPSRRIRMKLQNSLTDGQRVAFYKKGLFWLNLFLLLVLAACGGPRASTAQGPIPGKEEFGMTKEELYTAIENVEAEISQCMREAGFEYIAVDYSTVRRGMVADKSLPGMTEGEFISGYGFGISTLYTGEAPQLSELRTPAQIGLGEQNLQIYRNLSPADQVAYSHTLFGEHPDSTFAVALETEDFSRTGGCTRKAIEKFFTEEQMSATFLNPFDVLVDKDPRMVAANAKFANCLREAGFEYNHEKEIEPDMRKRLDAVTGGAPLEALSSEARTALTDLQTYERALAAATVSCEARYLDPVADQVEREYYAGPQQ